MPMKTEAHLRDTRNGRTAVYHDEWPDRFPDGSRPDAGNVSFQWLDGNYGCDCNRLHFLCEALGIDDETIECNTGENVIALDKLIVDGEELDV